MDGTWSTAESGPMTFSLSNEVYPGISNVLAFDYIPVFVFCRDSFQGNRLWPPQFCMPALLDIKNEGGTASFPTDIINPFLRQAVFNKPEIFL